VTLVVGLSLLAAVGSIVLTRSPPRVVRVGVPGGDFNKELLGGGPTDFAVCQPGESLPAGVTGIRLALWAFYGAQLHLRVYSGSRVVTEGGRGANWTSDSVTVPVKPLRHAIANVKLCFAVAPNSQPLQILGLPASNIREAASVNVGGSSPTPAVAGRKNVFLRGRMGVEYLAPGTGSWWSRILKVARHMGLGRSYTGTWIALLVAALVLAIGALAVRLTLRELP
jgi:hypothetical protein